MNVLCAVGGARIWGGAERMEVEGRRDDELLPVCTLQHSPVAIH